MRLRVDQLSMAVAALAMAATPLGDRGSTWRRRLAPAVVVPLFVASSARVSARHGVRRGLVAAGALGAAAWTIESIGLRTGMPFGRFRYTDALRPQIGGVPAVVPLAWVGMAVPARATAHAALGDASTPARRIVLGAVSLTAWDLFLDPQMVGEGYWRWASAGPYRGVPLVNYVGWLAMSVGAMALLEVADAVEPDPALVVTYAGVAAMETIAFATFLRDPVVAIVGGVAMGSVATTAIARLVGQRA